MKPARTLFALLALFALLLFTGTVSAQLPGGGRGGPPPGGGGRPSFDKLLDAFDANDDGKLDKNEVPPGVWRRLSQADANGDGVVTEAEYQAVRKPANAGNDQLVVSGGNDPLVAPRDASPPVAARRFLPQFVDAVVLAMR